jgi:hypothetical protein
VSTDFTPDLRAPGWTTRQDHGNGVLTLHYPTGLIRVEHLCTRPRDGASLLIAPTLTRQNQPYGHQIIATDPLTISPSILCEDCGLHGFITNGEWRGC